MKGQEEQTIEAIRRRYARVAGTLDERARRAVAASEALAVGWGGITAVARATGLSRAVIQLGIKELSGQVPLAAAGRIRRAGGGRKSIAEADPGALADLEQLVEPATRGDPESPLRWTSKSLRTLARELGERGHRVSHQWVAERLHEWEYSLQGTASRATGATIPTATPSSPTSTPPRRASWRRASRSSRWMPRRRSWWATSRMEGASGGPRGSRRRCACTTL